MKDAKNRQVTNRKISPHLIDPGSGSQAANHRAFRLTPFDK